MTNIEPITPSWRPMRLDDIPAVYALSRAVHADYPEREEVLAEKLKLFPAGCFALEAAETADGAHGGAPPGAILGYAFSHPWTKGSIPSLDTFLGALPDQPSSYFIHDVTLDATMRGQGHAAKIVPMLVDVARANGLTHMMLVAVNGAEVFWERFGFKPVDDVTAREKYGPAALLMRLRF